MVLTNPAGDLAHLGHVEILTDRFEDETVHTHGTPRADAAAAQHFEA